MEEMAMRMSIASKVFLLLLLLSLGSLTSSYARNDQKGGHGSGGGGHGSGAAHVAGGHGSGAPHVGGGHGSSPAHVGGGHGGNRAVAARGGAGRPPSGQRSGGGHPSAHVARTEPRRTSGAAAGPRQIAGVPVHRAQLGHAQAAAGGNRGAGAAQQPINRNRALAAKQFTPRNHAWTRSLTGTPNTSIGALAATSRGASAVTSQGALATTSRGALAPASTRNNANWSRDRSPEWHHAVAERRASWNRWTRDNRAQLQRFNATRDPQLSRITHWWNGKNVAQTVHSDPWNAYRDNVANFRNERRVEIWK